MKRTAVTLISSALVVSLALASPANASGTCQQRNPLVSSNWLDSHSEQANLVILDIRTADEYAAGHIANSINIPIEAPISAWITMRDDLLLEFPDTSDLFAVLESAGITASSKVIVVGGIAEIPYPQANATRVADTLLYAGVRDVAILNGGYPLWVSEGRQTTTETPAVISSVYNGTIDDRPFVDIDYVHNSIGTSIIVDARDANVYSGEVIESWALKAGHIPTALSMPAPLIWDEDGTYKSNAELISIVEGVVGQDSQSTEIILYCGVGGYASSWLYTLTQVLGYTNVKMYDGAAQEWVKYYDMEL